MATQLGKLDKEKKSAACLDFTAQLIRRLDSGNLSAVVLSELENHIQHHPPVPPSPKAIEFDRLGTQLWNATIRLKDQPSPILEEWPHLESQLRVYAVILLDSAQRTYLKHAGNKSIQNVVRVLKTALKAARICINANDLSLCTRLFEKVSDHIEHKQHPSSDPKRDKDESEAEDMLKELTADYYLLRATLSWKQDKPDNVGHWLKKVVLVPGRTDMLHLAEKKADLTYEMGKAALKKKHFDNAVGWLQESASLFDDLDPQMLSPECCDLRFVTMLDLARALVGVGDVPSLERASSIVVMLDQENGFKAEIFLLRLDIISAKRPFRADEFHGALLRIIRTVIISEGTFKAAMHQIQRLNTFDPQKEGMTNRGAIPISSPGPYSQLACQALELLLSRLLDSPKIEANWVERVVVTRIWISSLSLQDHQHLPSLEALFDEIHRTTGVALSPEATHASQSLIWKAVTALQQSQNEITAAEWCKLACHGLFSNAGELNKAKIGRKMIMSAISRGDAVAAREAYYSIPDNGKAAAMTNYLMYKVALREGDAELASVSLEGVLKSSTGADKFLYACALEALESGDRRQGIAAMKKVLELYERNPLTSGFQLPVLLRCIAGAIITEIKGSGMPSESGLTELCKIFEAAMRHASVFMNEEQSGSDDGARLAELRWFACHSYNTALKYCSEMNPKLLLRFMMLSVSLIDLLRKEDAQDNSLLSRILLCRFLAASTLIVMARSEDSIERSLQQYLDARRQIEAYRQLYREVCDDELLESEVMSDLAAKEFEMIKFDLEALMRLEHWNDLDRLLSMCLDQRHAERLENAADLILHIHTHIVKAGLDARFQSKIPSVMEKIISISWRSNRDITRLARWVRCVFQMTLNLEPTLSLRCVDQACAIAGKAQVGQMPEAYPRDEIEWLATMAFNHAVDLHFATDSEANGGDGNGSNSAQVWAEKALNLAMKASDGSRLHKVLQEKWLQLRSIARG